MNITLRFVRYLSILTIQQHFRHLLLFAKVNLTLFRVLYSKVLATQLYRFTPSYTLTNLFLLQPFNSSKIYQAFVNKNMKKWNLKSSSNLLALCGQLLKHIYDHRKFCLFFHEYKRDQQCDEIQLITIFFIVIMIIIMTTKLLYIKRKNMFIPFKVIFLRLVTRISRSFILFHLKQKKVKLKKKFRGKKT